MEYRALGNTGMMVSALSFGASSLGGVFHEIDETEGIKAAIVAVENGINFIDVSPYYGFTRAEKVLGKALKEIPRDKYYLSTKVGRYGENGEKNWDYSATRAMDSVKESMDRLNLDFIDLINCHDIEFANPKQIINETLPALHQLKEQGIVGHVGITGLPLDKLRHVVENSPESSVETVLSFCHYSLNDDSLADEIDFYESRGIGIINASPLSMGLLSERGAPDWHPASVEVKDACRKAADYCKTENYRIEQLAIKFSVSNPLIATTLVSTAKPENIKKNIEWAMSELNEQLLEEVLKILKPVHRQTWENS